MHKTVYNDFICNNLKLGRENSKSKWLNQDTTMGTMKCCSAVKVSESLIHITIQKNLQIIILRKKSNPRRLYIACFHLCNTFEKIKLQKWKTEQRLLQGKEGVNLEGSGCGHKRVTGRILVVMKMFSVLTVSRSIF